MRSIDLNADMGEYNTEKERQNEAALMPLVSSCSIACGGHTGTEETMQATVRLAKSHSVRAGAHPSYPDHEGFGRRSIDIPRDELEASLRTQIQNLKNILDTNGLEANHIKPHGALYNDAAKNIDLARLIARASGNTALVGPPGSALEQAASESGLQFFSEGFVDRRYLASGALTPRSMDGAIIKDVTERAAQATAIAQQESFKAADGDLCLRVDTLCIHSDSPGAVETATQVRHALETKGFSIRPFT